MSSLYKHLVCLCVCSLVCFCIFQFYFNVIAIAILMLTPNVFLTINELNYFIYVFLFSLSLFSLFQFFIISTNSSILLHKHIKFIQPRTNQRKGVGQEENWVYSQPMQNWPTYWTWLIVIESLVFSLKTSFMACGKQKKKKTHTLRQTNIHIQLNTYRQNSGRHS